MRHESVKEVSRYKFSSTDQLFLDANIWLCFYGPQQPQAPRYVKTYSDAFKRILSAQSHIHIDVLIVSEFINRCARLQWELAAPSIKNFKDFRNNPYFKLHAQGIVDDVKRILKHCSRIESGFEKLSINDLLDSYASGGFDFNDQVIAELCKREGLTLVTHDGDFKDSGIPILTANRNLKV